MASKPTDIDSLKIEIADDGTASLTGINYNDLLSILATASLHLLNPGVIEMAQDYRFRPRTMEMGARKAWYDQLWVCVSCGAECNTDCVGENCPACDADADFASDEATTNPVVDHG